LKKNLAIAMIILFCAAIIGVNTAWSQEFPKVTGLKAFTAQTAYLSLVGYVQLLAKNQTGKEITKSEALHIIKMQEAGKDVDTEKVTKKAKKVRKARKAKKEEVAPKAEEPKAVEPKAEEPKAEVKKEEPKAEAPKVEEPKAAEPKAEEPKAEVKKEEPKAEAPKAEEPKAAEPKAEEKK